jgi:hypothetical protein
VSNEVQLLTKPDGNILQTLQDPRVISTAVGAFAVAVLEKIAFTQPFMRGIVGFAAEDKGNLVILGPDANGKPDAKGGHKSALMTQRQLTRLAGVVGCVTLIENTRDLKLQYGLLGAAALLTARVAVDLIPGIQFSQVKVK